jgi:hypothetical protein
VVLDALEDSRSSVLAALTERLEQLFDAGFGQRLDRKGTVFQAVGQIQRRASPRQLLLALFQNLHNGWINVSRKLAWYCARSGAQLTA